MLKSNLTSLSRLVSAFFIAFLAISAQAQSSSFTFQGKLNDNNAAANGTYEMQFRLLDTGGTQIGTTNTIANVSVNNGIFTVRLTFGTLAFDGNPRFLEIAVRPAGSANPFTVLAPTQSVLSAPYSVRALSTGTADIALNSNLLGGLSASAFIQNTTTQQAGTNFSISGNGTLGGALSAENVNSNTQYSINNSPVLSVSGTGNTFVGLSSGAANTTGDANTFVGNGAGKSNTTGIWNSFYGNRSGTANTTGNFNSFFGFNAGTSNTTAINNSFFGQGAGFKNTTGQDNTFLGNGAGVNNSTASDNVFVGSLAGFNNTTGTGGSFFGFEAGLSTTTGDGNSFFGYQAGRVNTTGTWNVFIGTQTGFSNTTGKYNTFVGTFAGIENTTGESNAFFGLDTGRHNTTGESNSFFGDVAGRENTTGINNSYFGMAAARLGKTGNSNSIFGVEAGFNNNASNNSFFGTNAGRSNTTGGNNAFFGISSGLNNVSGSGNVFIGNNSGSVNTIGGNNTLLGSGANLGANNLNFATAIGGGAIVSANNTVVLGRAADTVQIPGSLNIAGSFGANIFNAVTQYNIGGNRILSAGGTNNFFAGNGSGANNSTGSGNSFFGSLSGQGNTTGVNNAFFGFNAGSGNNGGGANTFIGVNSGVANVGSSNNTFIGANAGNTNLTGSGNTYLGANSDGGFLVTNAVAIGQKAFVGQSNALILGSVNGINGATADTDVGIGTTTPVARLQIKDTSSTATNETVVIESSSPDGTGIRMTNTQFNNRSWVMYVDDGSPVAGTIHFTNLNSGKTVLSLSEFGGFGGSGTDGQMYVNGDTITTGYIIPGIYATGGTTNLCRNSVGTLSNCSSSIRYKKDVQPFTSGLATLKKLDPVTFRWKADNTPDLGFVAEDVAAVEPLLTTTNTSGQVEGVKYDRISTVLVNAVKEQQTQISEQQTRIADQQTQIDELKIIVCSIKPESGVCAKPK